MLDQSMLKLSRGATCTYFAPNGIDWKCSDTPIISHEESGYPNLYKSALVPHGSGDDLTFEFYFSGFSEGHADWRISRTVAKSVQPDS